MLCSAMATSTRVPQEQGCGSPGRESLPMRKKQGLRNFGWPLLSRELSIVVYWKTNIMGVVKICKCKLRFLTGMKSVMVIAACLAVLSFAGCASLSEADPFFVATTPEIYPPKDSREHIPLISENPAGKFKVIGTMDWEAPRRWNFVRRALERTARKHGADAIILRQKENFRETNLVDMPPTMRWVPVTRIVYVSSGPKNNRTTRAVPVTNFYPVFQPGFVAENVQDWTGVHADFIVFDSTKPLGTAPSIKLSAFDQ